LNAPDQPLRQRVPVPANIQQLHTANEEEWDYIPQPDQLYAEMSCGKWWSHQILTGFLIHAPTLKNKSKVICIYSHVKFYINIGLIYL
jgi:hypothetical protein